jgi:Ca2+/Na+ antiporter
MDDMITMMVFIEANMTNILTAVGLAGMMHMC